MNFNKLGINPRLLQGISERGYKEMTAVQEQTLVHSLQGRDVVVQSQTGTGKTAVFLITLFEHIISDNGSKRKKALIIVPTRELAVQIAKEAQLLNLHLDLRIGSFYGGVGYGAQLASLRRGLEVIIGTPGRLIDLSQKGQLKLKNISLLVIDEADRLFDMGFLPDIKKLIEAMPPLYTRQSMLFSATVSRLSRRIAAEYLNRPLFIEVTPEQLTVDTISQELYYVKSHIKMNLMLGILRTQAPKRALIFTNMRYVAFRLAKKLQYNGFRCQYLTGDLPQSRRLKIIKDFMAGKFAFLVATDVAARGLHIDSLEMVINYDLPQNCENYVHRIGRTARAGHSGKAISLASEGTANYLEAIESFIGMKIPVRTPDLSLYATDRSVEFISKENYRNNKSKNRK